MTAGAKQEHGLYTIDSAESAIGDALPEYSLISVSLSSSFDITSPFWYMSAATATL
jgi:hypothetical protein